ncbi:MAG: imidazolonepropionase [Proteobacteria bacterium]|nr:imidazolonepropionase [Pseudomonadota bacterium]
MKYDLIIKNIKTAYTLKNGNIPRIGDELKNLSPVDGLSVAIKNGKIIEMGKDMNFSTEKVIDASGLIALPGFVDPHTHAIFGGNRANEWYRRQLGESYLSILKSDGGIIDTVSKTRMLSKEEMIKTTEVKLNRMLASGTTTVEVKSGYGLDHDTEIMMLETAKELNKSNRFDIVSTYLGAHAIPKEYKEKRDEYVKLVLDMLDEIKGKELAEFVDVFCEEGAFTVEESREILSKAKTLGFKLRIHADELAESGGSILAGEVGARSADHLLRISDEGIKAMIEGNVAAVLLPGTAFQMGGKHVPPVRKMIDKGMIIALASDFNPGSCPIYSLPIIISLGVMLYKLTPEEAISAVTVNSAYVVDRHSDKGTLEQGKDADILLLDANDIYEIPYWFGDMHVKYVIKYGKIVYEGDRYE